MGKMYYTEEETAGKLGVSAEELQRLVEQAKLRVFSDGGKRMYKVQEVDAMAPPAPDESGEIELTPADTTDRDVVTLSEAGKPPEAAAKEDTVITTEGISIFDDEDLAVEAADPMAKTSIAPSVGDEISVEGVGSGSGLLDLTREPDDTSLGAVLEDISVESAVGSSAAAEALAEEVPAYAEPAPLVEAPMVVEEIDASTGAFSGVAVAACLLMLVMGAVAMAAMMQAVPRYLQVLQENLPIFLAVGGAVAIIFAVVGYFLGKSVADRAAALQRSTGS